MKLTWVQPEDLLVHELVQAEDEGRDVTAWRDEWVKAGGDPKPPVSGAADVPAEPALRERARTLLSSLNAANPGWSQTWEQYWESLDVDRLKRAAGQLGERPLTDAQYRERVEGAWYGRCIGCVLGKPVEKIPRQGIEEILRSTNRWPLKTWFTAQGLPQEVNRRWPWNRRSAPTSLEENIDGMPEDDDLNYPIMAVNLLETVGPEFTTEDVATQWLNLLPAGRTFTAERVAYRNLLQGRGIPDTAQHENPFREWIGALIRTEAYGWMNPDDFQAALRMAWEDARLSHTRNGVYGAVWTAALAWASLRAQSVAEVLDFAELTVPADSGLGEAIRVGRRAGADLRDRGASEEALKGALDGLHAQFGRFHWVHVLNNAAVIAFALAGGGGDFVASIALAVMSGWDTDSDGATVGATAGALAGLDAIPAYWVEPLAGSVATSLPVSGVQDGRLQLEELVERTVAVGRQPRSTRSEEK